MAEDPTRSAVENLLRLQRIGNGLSQEARVQLYELFGDIAAELVRIDPVGAVRNDTRVRRLRRLIERVEEITGESFDAYLSQLRQDLALIGADQGEWAVQHLRESIGGRIVAIQLDRGRVGVNAMKAILDSNPFQGDILADWVEAAGQATVRRVRRAIQLGMTEGRTLDEIVRDIRGRPMPNGGFAGGILDASHRDVEAVVRTGVNFIANRGHMGTFDANADIVLGVEYTATLDSRTTLICASLDGSTWPLGSEDIRTPPQHYQCRSVLTPLLNWNEIGVEPPDDGTRASRTYRVENGELVQTGGAQVKASTTYSDWFSRQSAAVQDEIVGPARAKLFREGKITFKDMVTKDGRVIPLERLRNAA